MAGKKEGNGKSGEKFRKLLSPEQYHILFGKGTEAPFSGKYVLHNEDGAYACAACGNILFDSETKFDSSCGWPSFYDAKKGSVEFSDDNSRPMHRIEVMCAKCGGHLGHVFDDGPAPTGKRFCINSLSLEFKKGREKGEKP